LKVLYGTGAMKLNDKTSKAERVGGIKWTVKDGIVYDAKQLLADVRSHGRETETGTGENACERARQSDRE